MTNQPPQSEKAILNDILMDVSARPKSLVYRNNTGQAWQGRPVDVPVGHTVRVEPGMKILAEARPINFGLLGSGDATGAIQGRPLMIETKTAIGSQRATQQNFERAWVKAGGIYLLARSVSECNAKLNDVLRN